MCVVKWKIIPKFLFNPQVPKVNGWMMEWPILRELTQELGEGWVRNIFHGVTICATGCPATVSKAGRERLSNQAGRVLRTYVSDLDIRIKIYRHKLEEALQMKKREHLKRKRDDEGEGKGKKMKTEVRLDSM